MTKGNLKWVKWTKEEHLLCTDEFNPLKTKVASLYCIDKYYNLWSIYINHARWDNQPFQSEEVQSLRQAKKLAYKYINSSFYDDFT